MSKRPINVDWFILPPFLMFALAGPLDSSAEPLVDTEMDLLIFWTIQLKMTP